MTKFHWKGEGGGLKKRQALIINVFPKKVVGGGVRERGGGNLIRVFTLKKQTKFMLNIRS